MLYTPVPGTPLYLEMQKEGRLLDVNLADIHGQDAFNFQHAAISREQSRQYLDWATINMPFYTPGGITAAGEALRPLVGLQVG